MKKILVAMLSIITVMMFSITSFASSQADCDKYFAELEKTGKAYMLVVENGEIHYYIKADKFPKDMSHKEIMEQIRENLTAEEKELLKSAM